MIRCLDFFNTPSPVGEGWGEGELSEDRRVGGLEDKLFNVNGLPSKLPIFLPSELPVLRKSPTPFPLPSREGDVFFTIQDLEKRPAGGRSFIKMKGAEILNLLFSNKLFSSRH